jgi:thiol-disulfide isomerase/thioredoxin
LPDVAAMHVKDGKGKLNFSFLDLNKKKVSINDPKFKNKVVVIQIMGSWCPNCMDETAFLSEYYNKNKQRGVLRSLVLLMNTAPILKDQKRALKNLRTVLM